MTVAGVARLLYQTTFHALHAGDLWHEVRKFVGVLACDYSKSLAYCNAWD